MGKWIEGYGFSHRDISIANFLLDNQTIRYKLPIGISGSKLEITFSNRYGREDLVLDRVSIGRVLEEGVMEIDQPLLLTHNNSRQITIPKGEDLSCDLLDYRVRAGQDLGISIYIGGKAQIRSGGSHVGRRYVSVKGDYTEEQKMPCIKIGDGLGEIGDQDGQLEYFTSPTVDIIKSINVFTKPPAYSIAAFGDSVTAMDYWRQPLAKRLEDKYDGLVTVLNYGIIGNRLLHDTGMRGIHGAFGGAGKGRILRDGLQIKGLKYLILLAGTNDLIQPGVSAPLSQSLGPREIIQAYKDIIKALNQEGIKVIGGTLPPFCGMDKVYWREAESHRQTINRWIRQSKDYHGIIDFDKILADKENKDRIKGELHIGDWLHPNRAAGKLIADNIPLDMFS